MRLWEPLYRHTCGIVGAGPDHCNKARGNLSAGEGLCLQFVKKIKEKKYQS